MNITRYVKIEDNPAQSLQRFLSTWWESYRLDVLYAPVLSTDGLSLAFQAITIPGELSTVNPFIPVMQANAAPVIRHQARQNPEQRSAALLRPCELRAYIELEKMNGDRDRSTDNGGAHRNPVIIGIDCLGTFSGRDYQRQVAQRGVDHLLAETWENSRQGGLHPLPYRMACQMCDWPAPRGADFAIGYLGVPADGGLLIIAPDETRYNDLALMGATDGFAYEGRVSRREAVVGAIADMHGGVRRKYLEQIEGMCRFDDIGCLLAWMANCSLCGSCLSACPFVEDQELAQLRQTTTREKPAEVGRERYYTQQAQPRAGLNDTQQVIMALMSRAIDIGRQLASCDGCGMCAEACESQVPLMLVITALSHAIQEKFHYLPGEPAAALPWQPGYSWR